MDFFDMVDMQYRKIWTILELQGLGSYLFMLKKTIPEKYGLHDVRPVRLLHNRLP